MDEKDRKKILDALDMLALALTEYGHQWTDEQRRRYDEATALLETE